MSDVYSSLQQLEGLIVHVNMGFNYNIQGSEVYSEKSGGHPLIYLKGHAVELVSSNITLSVLERFPPWNSSVVDSLS